MEIGHSDSIMYCKLKWISLYVTEAIKFSSYAMKES